MLTIALTSIPPRLPFLGPVLNSLLNQTIPARVVLSLPRKYRRFPGIVQPPNVPPGIGIRRIDTDFGPATKLLGVLTDPESTDILYCDDDWIYAPTWAANLLNARPDETTAIAGSSFSISRLKRHAKPPFDQVAQGFGGVLVQRSMFGKDLFDLPPAAFAADDIWLSGLLAYRQIPVVAAHGARTLCSPVNQPGPQLQSSVVNGLSRAEANTACANALTERFDIWPEK